MFIKRNRPLYGDDIASSDITPRSVFDNRRRVLRAAGAIAATGLVGVNGEAFATMTSSDAKGPKLAATPNTKFV
ncbi:MAG: protein-methionine-sulfoxide reductase catalytic subunit MsrP, partial [Caballeronia sp.]